jgi:hypothetical protein
MAMHYRKVKHCLMAILNKNLMATLNGMLNVNQTLKLNC